MVMHWVLFVVTVILAYTGISWFAQLSGGSSQTAVSAFVSALHPMPLVIVTVANMFFGLGLYYGFGLTRYAIPIAISLGVITSFLYSVAILGATVTGTKIIGVLVIIIGVIILSV